MSLSDLETELARRRDPRRSATGSNAKRLSVAEALAFRDLGNVPDAQGRTLRLVLRVDDEPLSKKRLRYEPDYHEEPSWRRDGSKAVNIVPLTSSDPDATPPSERAWWEQPDVAELELEWQETGTAAGLRVPGAYRGFVLKTIAALRASRIPITVDSVSASLARWLSAEQVEEVRGALREANE